MRLKVPPDSLKFRRDKHFSGGLRLQPQLSGVREEIVENKHVRAVVHFGDGSELFLVDPRKFAVVWYGRPEEVMSERYLAGLGPDALTIEQGEFVERLCAHRGMLKPLLLRQTVVAGLGNYLVDEILWRVRLHPRTKVDGLGRQQIRRLHTAMRNLLERSIRAGGLSLRDWLNTDGSGGRSHEILRVYAHGGRPCMRCRTSIVRIVVGGRGTYVCGNCQKYA